MIEEYIKRFDEKEKLQFKSKDSNICSSTDEDVYLLCSFNNWNPIKLMKVEELIKEDIDEDAKAYLLTLD